MVKAVKAFCFFRRRPLESGARPRSPYRLGVKTTICGCEVFLCLSWPQQCFYHCHAGFLSGSHCVILGIGGATARHFASLCRVQSRGSNEREGDKFNTIKGVVTYFLKTFRNHLNSFFFVNDLFLGLQRGQNISGKSLGN